MSLCPSRRCGCAFDTETLTIARSGDTVSIDIPDAFVYYTLEDTVQAMAEELGPEPSGSHPTVAARLDVMDATNTTQSTAITTAQSTANGAATAASNAQTTANTGVTNASAAQTTASNAAAVAAGKTAISSRFVTITGGTSALGNNNINLRAGTVVVTLGAFGVAGILFPSVINASYVPVVCNGDTGTANGGATVGLDTWDGNGMTIHMQRADGTAGTGSVRINYHAIGI